ncbi:MAG: stage V sporulation protein AEB [Peptococcaceae bacterium BICA1-8]|nr:MAG: stage V sporulation protein AEB [Peptococcaceae bacterium BICA1-8]
MFENIFNAFLIGGIICVIGQLIMDLTPFVITPAHVLVGYVTSGGIISAVGLYEPLIKFGGAGAVIPLSGFGHSLAQGAIEGAKTKGLLGAIGGGFEATAVGIVAAILLGLSMATIFNPKG